ncbi:zinc ribbon domain-containing protein [Embleya scabrispora]|uniref:zinc ribbon domain-containing protein n=1 Tax=Embleya scabrispora TaxID=159449 RepID=UPI00038180DB|nr:zinc ribbon domain-containing protein [Embleya scabrispora]MYS81956.1 hypothetical protein [Streptomyces sp. SID5474]
MSDQSSSEAPYGQGADLRPDMADRLRSYWGFSAQRERQAAIGRAAPRKRRHVEVQCGKCGSTKVSTDIVGDYVCGSCAARWRPPTAADGPTCPECGSGKVSSMPYGDRKCRDCDHQWRPS